MSKDIIKPAKPIGKSVASSSKQLNKRPNSEMSPNTSAEEINLLSHHLEGLSDDVKGMREELQSIMKKDQMEIFIKETVTKIISELNENMETTISIKVDEKTNGLQTKMSNLETENKQLKADFMSVKTQLSNMKKTLDDADQRSKTALKKSNYNEQYSRKNNVKILNVNEQPEESEESLTKSVCDLLAKKKLTLDPSKIVAIYRIPGKEGFPKLVLIKLLNNNEKSKVMRRRKDFKQSNRFVDDVTKSNVELMTRLMEHPTIQQAWYFNGAVYAEGAGKKKVKFDLFDNIEEVLKK